MKLDQITVIVPTRNEERNRVCFSSDLIVHARDHRRLEQGRLRKTLHSLTRCLLLYAGLMPKRWRSADWGYWPPGRGGRQRRG